MRIKLKSHSLYLSFHLCRRCRNYVCCPYSQVVHTHSVSQKFFFDRTKWINDSFLRRTNVIAFIKRMLVLQNCFEIFKYLRMQHFRFSSNRIGKMWKKNRNNNQNTIPSTKLISMHIHTRIHSHTREHARTLRTRTHSPLPHIHTYTCTHHKRKKKKKREKKLHKR